MSGLRAATPAQPAPWRQGAGFLSRAVPWSKLITLPALTACAAPIALQPGIFRQRDWTMSKKRVGVAVVGVVAAAVVAYGGATWYVGQRVQTDYQEVVAELRKALGDDVVVSNDYDKGFFSSKARLVLRWAPAPHEEGGPAPEPLRLVVDSAVRHGPLAGARIAGAVIDSRFALEGLDADAQARLAKASSPILTTVHHLTGSHDVHFQLPAGEMGDSEGMAMRWHEMVYDMAISRDGRHLQGSFRLPEFGLTGIPDESALAESEGEPEEENDNDETAAVEPVDRTSIQLQGMDGRFDVTAIDGLWGIGPGKGDFRMERAFVSMLPAAGGDAKPLLDVKNVAGNYAIDAANGTLGMTTQLKAAGRVGPIDFEALSAEEKIQRISIEAIRSFQRVVLDSYRAGGIANAVAAIEQQGTTVLMENAPRLVQALPAYSMQLKATYQGKTGELQYGGEVKRAPSEAEVAQAGWGPALMKTSTLQASARLPKAWMLPLAHATGRPQATERDVDAMLGMAQSSGYVRQEGEFVTSTVQLQSGQLNLNGKTMPLPPGLLR